VSHVNAAVVVSSCLARKIKINLRTKVKLDQGCRRDERLFMVMGARDRKVIESSPSKNQINKANR